MVTDRELARLLAALSEPALVVRSDGVVVLANRAASRSLSLDDAAGVPIQQLTTDPETTARLLGTWSRSASPLPGALRVRGAAGPAAYRAEGARISAPGEAALILLRLRRQASASGAFNALNEKISALGAEITRRMRAESLLAGQLRLLELIATGESLPASLDAIARYVESESANEALASVLLVQNGTLHHGAAPSLPVAYSAAIDGLAVGPAAGSCGTAAHRREPVAVSDIEHDPLWADFRDLALEHGLRACWSTPVIGASGDVLATVAHYYREPRAPDPGDEQLTETARHLVGIAIERHHREASLAERAADLADMNERTNQFLAMLGHELRNPLSPMVTTLELLREGGGSTAEREEWMEVLSRKLGLMRRLVDDLLDIARVTRDKIELQRTSTDLRQIVKTAVLAQGAVDSRIRVELPPEALWVDADPHRMQQVVDNLVNNARKFTPDDGSIRVIVDAVDGKARLRVRDTGEGIEPDELPHMFELFAQSHRSLDRSQGGLGIGLTLAESLVARHGGSIEARSAGRGRGSEFEILLPPCEAPSDAVRDRSEDDLGVEPGAALDILVVDDDEEAARLLGGLLESWGHRVRLGHDGEAALDAVADVAPEFMILDIGLPLLDGFEVAKRVRGPEAQLPASATLVALSGYGQEADKQRALAAGFDEYLVKPVDLQRLKRLIETRARS